MGPGLKDHQYTKVPLISNEKFSCVLFVPKTDVAVTPPHSHHCFDAASSASPSCYENSIAITHREAFYTKDDDKSLVRPETLIATEIIPDLKPGECVVAPELPSHIVFWSSRPLEKEDVIDLISQMSGQRGCPEINTSAIT